VFADLAPALYANGFRSLLPIIPREKRPAFARWQNFNQRNPTEFEIQSWIAAYPRHGIGLAYGPDGVTGIDLDFTDVDVAKQAYEIVVAILGATPLIRVGLPPKKLMLYRCPPSGLSVLGKAFGRFEVFTRSGQTVLYGVHPQGHAYRWLTDTPVTIKVADLPLAISGAVDAVIDALRPLCSKPSASRVPASPRPKVHARVQTRDAASDRTIGSVADVLPSLRAADNALKAARDLVAAAAPGNRYPTGFGVVVSLVKMGFSDDDIRAAVFDPYLALFTKHEQAPRSFALESALDWTRSEIGDDNASAIAAVPMVAIAQAWRARRNVK
jgi:Bifunctional DNA primase/polymerase, N-terminal